MFRRLAVIVISAIVLPTVLAGCKGKPEPELTPEVKPPAIAEAGVLRVGVDLSTPPFGGVDGSMKAGIDVDVAAAVAERLGLRVEYVDVSPSDAATALADGVVDTVYSVRLDTADLSRVTAAGSYLSDAPGIFVATEDTASIEPSLTVDSLPDGRIGVQSGSESYWVLLGEVEGESVLPYDTLREALEALESGSASMVVGDALVGAYIGRDYPTVHLAGQLADAYPLAAVVAAENTELSDVIREALDELAADGVLDSVRRKWVGDLPPLRSAEDDGEL